MNNALKSLGSTIWGICLFKNGPQDLPFSKKLFYFLIVINFIFAWLALLSTRGVSASVMDAALNIAITLVFTQVVLAIHQKRQRFIQTTTGLLATGLLISLIGLLLLIAFFILKVIVAGIADTLFFTVITALFVWLLIVQGHIYRHALEKSLFFGTVLAILLLIINGAVLELAKRLMS